MVKNRLPLLYILVLSIYLVSNAYAAAPVVTTTTGTTVFTIGLSAVSVDSSISVSDDLNSIVSGTVSISNRLDGTLENLSSSLTPSSTPVSASYNAATGMMTFTGVGTGMNYRTALGSVKYNNTSASPNMTARAIQFTASDSTARSAVATKWVSLRTQQPAGNTAPIVSLTSGTIQFVANQGAVFVDSGMTVGDDSTTIGAASVLINNFRDATYETLTVDTLGYPITTSYGNGQLSLSGQDTPAHYQDVLRTLRFNDTCPTPNTETRSLQISVYDGWLWSSASVVKMITIINNTIPPSNSAPIVTISTGSIVFTKGQSSVTVDGSVTVSDDSGRLFSATVAIGNLLDGSAESLSIILTTGMTATYNSNTGTLILNGSRTDVDYQSMFRWVKYNNTSSSPNTTPRMILFTVNDGTLSSTTASKLVSINTGTTPPPPANTAPVITLTTGTTVFTQGQGAVTVDGSLSLSDDSGSISFATVSIGNLLNGSSESLSATLVSGITSSYDMVTGALFLTGIGSDMDYRSILRSVKYNNSSLAPNTTTRSIRFSAGDGMLTSAMSTKLVSINTGTTPPPPTAPVITTTTGTTVFTRGQGAVVIDGGISVSSYNNAIVSVSVRIISQYDPGLEYVMVDTTGYSAVVSYSSGSVMTITAAETDSRLSSLLRLVKYNNNSISPNTTTRQIEFIINDGTTTSTPAIKRVSIVNAASGIPIVTASTGTTVFMKGQGAVVVDPGLTVTDDSVNLVSATVTLVNHPNGSLESLTTNTVMGISASYCEGSGELSLSGVSSISNYQSLLRSIRYNNTSATPSTTNRTISFIVSDGAHVSSAASKIVSVSTGTNAAPVVTTTTGTTAFTQGQGAVTVDSMVTVTDDSGSIASATATIANLLNGSSESLSVTLSSGITASYNASTGVLTLMGNHTDMEYRAVVRTIKYNNTSSSPNTTTRTIRFAASDGTLTSPIASKQVSIATPPSNTVPLLTTSTGTTVFTKGQGAVVVDAGMTVSASGMIASATVSISNHISADAETLTADTSGTGISSSYCEGQDLLTLSGSANAATYQNVLRSVRYNNASANPNTTPRKMLITASSGGFNSAAAAKVVSIATGTNTPVISLSTLPTGATTNNVIMNITGNAGSPSGVQTVTLASGGTSTTLDATGFCHALALKNGANTITITATDGLGNQIAETRDITVDASAPQLSVATPADNSTVVGGVIDVVGAIADPNTTIDVSVNGGTPQAALVSGMTYTAPVALESGMNTIEIVATDSLNNKNTSKRTVHRDSQGVSLQVTEPGEDEISFQKNRLIRGHVADYQAGVTVTMDVDGQIYTPVVTNGEFEQNISFAADKTYHVKVFAMDGAGYTASAQRNIVHENVTLTADMVSPQLVGSNSITFTAGGMGGNGNYEYKYWVKVNGTWTPMQEYSPSKTWTWNTFGVSAGSYDILVYARNVGSSEQYEAVNSQTFVLLDNSPATGAALTPDTPSPLLIGNNTITYTAGGSGGSGNYEYKFWLKTNGVWSPVQEYSPTNTWTWNTTGAAPGAYAVQVYVRNSGSMARYEAVKNISYVLTDPATSATLNADIASPQNAGNNVTFTAGGIGGSGNYEYKFWIKAGGVWTVVQDYSTTNVFSWNTSGLTPGTYRAQVYVRTVGSNAKYEAVLGMGYVIK